MFQLKLSARHLFPSSSLLFHYEFDGDDPSCKFYQLYHYQNATLTGRCHQSLKPRPCLISFDE